MISLSMAAGGAFWLQVPLRPDLQLLGIAAMGSATLFFWLQAPLHADLQLLGQLLGRRFSVVQSNGTDAYAASQSGASFSDAHRYVVWLLTVPSIKCYLGGCHRDIPLRADHQLLGRCFLGGAGEWPPHRYADWLLMVPLLLIEVVLVIRRPQGETMPRVCSSAWRVPAWWRWVPR